MIDTLTSPAPLATAEPAPRKGARVSPPDTPAKAPETEAAPEPPPVDDRTQALIEDPLAFEQDQIDSKLNEPTREGEAVWGDDPAEEPEAKAAMVG